MKKIKIKFLAMAAIILCGCLAPIACVRAVEIAKPDGAEWLVNEGENHVWYQLAGTTLTIGGSGEMPDWKSSSTVEGSYTTAPWYGKNITKIIIDDGVTGVGEYSFVSLTSLTVLELSDSVKAIGDGAFKDCSNLATIKFGKGLKRIGLGAFGNCGFTSMTIPEGVTKIDWYAFRYNDKLTEVILPSTLEEIGGDAFYMNATNALKKIVSYAPIAPTLGNNTVFKNVTLEKLTVPNDSLDSYKTGWNIDETTTEISATLPTTVHTWDELQNEINNATEVKAIRLGSNIVAPNPTTDVSIIITVGKDITLDLNGHVLDRGLIADDGTATANASGSVIQVAGKLTIIDSNPDAEHKGTLSENGYFWNWDDGANTGTTIIKGGIITGGCRSGSYNGGSGVRVDNNAANFTMKGGTITGNKSLNKAHAGGVYVNYGAFNMTGGTIIYNSANQHGGGVFVRYGQFIMDEGAKITKNSVSSNGGGVYLMSNTNSSFTMNGGEISYNVGNLGGGVRTESSITLTGGAIKNNIARDNGGGVRGTVIMSGGEISGNTATNEGGGIYSSSTVTGGVISGNISGGDGGGIYGGKTTVGGSAVISENFKGEVENNLFLNNLVDDQLDASVVITISDDVLPTSDMNIGVTSAVAPDYGTPVPITSNSSDGVEAYFSSDNPAYYVLNQDNILKLVKDSSPTGEISIKENSFTSFLNEITFGLFFNEKFDVEITASDDIGVKSIEYYVSDKQLTEDEVKAIEDWTAYSKFAIESEDKYVVYAKITDSIDNVTYISSNGFVLDMTAPAINELDATKIYYTTQKFTVEDSYIDKVLIDGVETTDYTLPGNVDQTYEIDALDKAGNPTYLSIRMMPISAIGMLLDDYTVENVTINDKDDIENVKEKVGNIDTTNATDGEKAELQEIINKCDELLEVIENKYMSEVELTVTPPKPGQTVSDNTFEIVSKYDNIIVSVKEWRLNGGSEALPNDYVFAGDTTYIPILKIEVKDQTRYFDENTTLTVHGSTWNNGEGTFSLKDHEDYGYVKDLNNGSFLINEMTIRTDSEPEPEPEPEEEPEEEPGVPDTGDFITEHTVAIAGLAISLPIFAVLLYVIRRAVKR